MKLYSISYDIDNNEQNFIVALKNLGDTCNYVKSGWFLRTNEDNDVIYKKLQPFFADGNGHLLVAKVNEGLMSGWLSSNTIDWLMKGTSDDN